MTSDAGPHDGPNTERKVAATISDALVRVHRDFLGRGPERARTTVSEDSVMVVFEETLTHAERSLLEDGKDDEVLRLRHSLQRTMEGEYRSAVERITGRTVRAFMSANHVDPDLACEVFVLEPRAGDDPGSRS